MAKYIIDGGNILRGEITVSGNKNSVLPCMAAALLTEDEVVLKNVPDILDVHVMCDILRSLGVGVELGDKLVRISAKKISETTLPQELVSKLRASVLLAGALLGRKGKAEFIHPGGDVIGKRGIELHLEGFRKLGFKVDEDDRRYKASRSFIKPRDCKIFLEIPTVTGTENLILASVLGRGSTSIRNAAQEPHVVDLCNLLNKMGAKILGISTSELTIEGVEKLGGAEFTIGPDNIEFGTYAIAGAITNGQINFKNCQDMDMEPICWPLQKMGIEIKVDGGLIKTRPGKLTAIPKLITNVWPGFPTDLMSCMVVLATQAKGVSLLHDWLYESRMFFVDKLISMGAHITIADPHRVVVYGPTQLKARELETPDIRAGMALVLAGLVAKGSSVINRAELIERGYENVVDTLSGLGAKIERMD